jgi:tetratricopeptide (TPR) repeat protein
VAADLHLAGDSARALGHLVDASMLEATLGGHSRYRMLDIIRAFAREQLDAHDEADTATERFVQWALDLVAWIDHASTTDQEPQADRALRAELSNLRAAWRFTRAHDRSDDAVRIVVGLTDAAGWRDLPELWEWALELTDDSTIHTHPEAATVLGLAAASAWSRGELDRADRLARSGLALDGDDWRCQAALALVALSRGDLAAAISHGTKAASGATRIDQSLGVAALAAAYAGDLDEATRFNKRLAVIGASPTIQAFHLYVAGEVDALAGLAEGAEAHYQRAIALARGSGATFIEGIASVGLQTLRANAGRVTDALDGYQDPLSHWMKRARFGVCTRGRPLNRAPERFRRREIHTGRWCSGTAQLAAPVSSRSFAR